MLRDGIKYSEDVPGWLAMRMTTRTGLDTTLNFYANVSPAVAPPAGSFVVFSFSVSYNPCDCGGRPHKADEPECRLPSSRFVLDRATFLASPRLMVEQMLAKSGLPAGYAPSVEMFFKNAAGFPDMLRPVSVTVRVEKDWCTLCFKQFAPGDLVFGMPNCAHKVHERCLWPLLEHKLECPYCTRPTSE